MLSETAIKANMTMTSRTAPSSAYSRPSVLPFKSVQNAPTITAFQAHITKLPSFSLHNFVFVREGTMYNIAPTYPMDNQPMVTAFTWNIRRWGIESGGTLCTRSGIENSSAPPSPAPMPSTDQKSAETRKLRLALPSLSLRILSININYSAWLPARSNQKGIVWYLQPNPRAFSSCLVSNFNDYGNAP